ncbi:hypothetical protein NBM05_09505 [Rothia sp. AR01]|uniref:Uncharacterized protein n=1 Tax=Rothia santali TaxID=2949643 RepID=A0A9X2KIV7_9MICC|nr:hypothetical protein [Rothia santali]MCP3426234.1 hypothetical protein [Rothia santali]
MSDATGRHAPLPERLHAIFDEQVMNYGAYNLLYASGSAQHLEDSVVQHQSPDQRHFIVGYRRAPAELVLAPFDPATMTSQGLPMPADNTNTVALELLPPRRIRLETTSGTRFDLEVSPLVEITTPCGQEILEQEDDVDDFTDFIRGQVV